MIGFYNYSVILTYLGLASSIVGITEVFRGNYKLAILCLLLSGTCDMFDGKVARAMKNRTDNEKVFGIEIDSLCDLVCFGVLPGLYVYNITQKRVLGTIAAVVYTLAAVIRLGYFNVMEQARQQETNEKRKYYQGLPVTTISMILPFFYTIQKILGVEVIPNIYHAVLLLIVAFLFVFDFKVKKPGSLGCIIMTIYGAAILAAVIIL